MKNDYVKSEIPFQDIEPRMKTPSYSRISLGKVLTVGTVCALIAAQDYPNNANDLAFIKTNVAKMEQYEAQLAENIKGFKKVMSAIVVNNNDMVRQTLLDQLMSFRSLIHSWDGYGAVPTTARCAASVVRVMEGLSNQAIEEMEDFFPNTNGSVSFKWVNALGEKLSLSIGVDSFSYYSKRNGVEVEMFDEVIINKETIEKLNTDIRAVMIANV